MLFPLALQASWQEKLNQNNDHGLWLEQNINCSLPCQWSAHLHVEQRWGADYQKLWFYEYIVTALYHFEGLEELFQDISCGPSYGIIDRLVKNQEEKYVWITIHQYLLDVNATYKYCGWVLQNRIRAAYNATSTKAYKDHGSLRYRMVLNAPWKWTCFEIGPYLSNEFFFRQNTYSRSDFGGHVGVYHENRFRLGLIGGTEPLTTAVYWQWEAVKKNPGTHPRWFNLYQFGWVINLFF